MPRRPPPLSAGDRLLGHLWWLALVGLLIAGGLAGSALFIRAEEVGLDLTSNIEIAEEASSDDRVDMASDAAAQRQLERRRSRRRSQTSDAGTVEIEIGGRKVKARKQTVPTGAGSVAHFFSKLFG